MSTRDISTQRAFPMVPATFGSEEEQLVWGLADIFFIVRGLRDGEDLGLSGRGARLISWTSGGTTTDLVFRVNEETSYWDFTFTVPNNSVDVEIGKAVATVSGDSYAVLFYNSDTIPSTTNTTDLEVEPCRAQWLTEQVDSIGFYNIGRCYDEEFEAEEYLVKEVNAGDPDLDMEDGYNTALTVNDTELLVNAQAGIGKGTADEAQIVPPGRVPCDVPSRLNATYVTTVNGLQAVDGDLNLEGGGSLTVAKEIGSIIFRDAAT